MQAEKFYQQALNKGILIEIIQKSDWLGQLEQLSTEQQEQLKWQTFSANPGEIFLLLDHHGQLQKVFLATAPKRDFFAIASAALKLPPGHYRFKNALSSYNLMAWGMAQYKFLRYKNTEIMPKVLDLSEKLYQRVVPLVDAVFKVRDLINTPAEDMGPEDLSTVVQGLAQKYQAEFTSIVGDDLLKQNFPAIYTVGRAAMQAPRLLKLVWGQAQHPKVILVGKGVCFDSGGLNLKPASAMRTMKKDMGGAAQVIGLAQLIMHYQLPIHLQVLIPAVENAIDGHAYRPGDVIRMRNGLHVEIDNTDAEGRLVLADALVYACEQSPEMLIDFATLTGAARTAVGTEISALFSNQDKFARSLQDLSLQTNDWVWQLPLYESYLSMLDSNIADISNSSSSPYAGAITAALFMKKFVDEKVCWAHFDLMAWNIASKPGRPEGGEAMAILSVFEFLSNAQ
jgi:leucyl aminopeptidase